MDLGNIIGASFESIFLLLLWGLIVGFVFSSIGAAGGILASFALITVIGISDPNSVKPMAQILAIATALVFIPGYFKRQACILPLGIMLSAGGVLGAIIGSTVSSKYLSDMSSFKPLFGILSFLVATQIVWKLYQQKKQQEDTIKISKQGIQNLTFTPSIISFDYADKSYRFSTWAPALAGFVIAFIASIFGVGGGFLLVPYLASIMDIPMFIVPATVALAVLISCMISVSNYIRMGSEIDYSVLFFLIIGGIVGAKLGPKINQLMREHWLQASLAFIVAAIGIKYLLQGFTFMA